MKLLIIEDSTHHQAAARTQFPEAVVVNYDEAYTLLKGARPGQFSAILTDLHFKIEESRKIPSAPFAGCYKNNMGAIGKEEKFGLAFVLKGIELNTPVALVSEVDHHSDLTTGLLNMLGSDGLFPYEGGSDDPIPNPKFLLLRDNCPRAEDMHWDGTQIVLEAPPKDFWKSDVVKMVKDWREALRQLMKVMQVPASA